MKFIIENYFPWEYQKIKKFSRHSKNDINGDNNNIRREFNSEYDPLLKLSTFSEI
jgi:hypothetical protein